MKAWKKVGLAVVVAAMSSGAFAYDFNQAMTNIVSNAINGGMQQQSFSLGMGSNQGYNQGGYPYNANARYTPPSSGMNLGSLIDSGPNLDEIYSKVESSLAENQRVIDRSLAKQGVTAQQCRSSNTLMKIDEPPALYANTVSSRFAGTQTGNYFDLFAVSSVGNLLRGRPNQNFVAVAIPSLEALEYYDGVKITEDVKMNSAGMLVSRDMAELMRAEMAARNITPQNTSSLRDFTSKQLAALAMVIKTKSFYRGRNMEPYLDSTVIAYTRAKQMCVYDTN